MATRLRQFTVCLGKLPANASVQEGQPDALGKVHILVVEGNATSRKILTTRLAPWGARPTVAVDGPTDLRTIRHDHVPCRPLPGQTASP